MTLEEEVESAIKGLKALTENVEGNLRESLENIEISLSNNLEHLKEEREEKRNFSTKENKETVEEREITLRRALKDFNKLVPRTREEIKTREDRLITESLKEELKECNAHLTSILEDNLSLKAIVDELDSNTRKNILLKVYNEGKRG